jgi:Tfp pilus assembly protein PilN
MKINTNLAEPTWRLPLLSSLVLLLVMLVSSVLSILGWLEYGQHQEELTLLEQRMERLREKRAEANGSVPLSPSEMDALVARVAEVNELLSRGSGRLPVLLASMENAVPDELVLQSLHYDGRRHEFALVAEASDSSNLAAFVSALQTQEHFESVQLRRQRQAGSDGELVQLELNVMERRL